MRTMETHEITLTAKELQALAEGTALTAPLGDNRRLVLSVAMPAETDDDGNEDTDPEDIQAGMEVEE